MNDTFAESAVRFFFLLCLNETKAASFGKQVLRRSKKSQWLQGFYHKKNPNPDRIHFLKNCLSIYFQNRDEIMDHREIQFGEINLLVMPKKMNLGPWQRFLKEAPEAELLTVLLVYAFKANHEEIARLLNVSPGAITSRLQNSHRRIAPLIVGTP